jgi:hypothetical protein
MAEVDLTDEEKEWLEVMLRGVAAREAQLRKALDFGLQHVDAPAGSGAVLSALATLRSDTVDDQLLAMAETVLQGLVHRNPAARQAAQRWYAQRQGCSPDGDAAEILQVEAEVKAAINLYRRSDGRVGVVVDSAGSRSYVTVPVGPEAIEAFRSDYLSPRFGEHAASVRQLRKWFGKLDQSRLGGGLSVSGIVARILHRGRRATTKRPSQKETVNRVDRVLASHAKRRK